MVTESMFSFLLSNPGQKVFIQDGCTSTYHAYLDEHLATWLAETLIPRVLKTAVFAESMRGQFARAFEFHSVQKLLECSNQCGETSRHSGRLCIWMDAKCTAPLGTIRVFVTHAVNTAFYAYLITEQQGHVEESISEICSGVMLHDIGKIELESILSREAVSNEPAQDWTQRREKAHPTEGFKSLCHEPGVTATQLMVCYQHHERPDGHGFPVGLVRDEIDVASKICAVANRFDGLTCQREGRPGRRGRKDRALRRR